MLSMGEAMVMVSMASWQARSQQSAETRPRLNGVDPQVMLHRFPHCGGT